MRLPLGVKLTLTTSVVVAVALGTFAWVTGKTPGRGVSWISAGALVFSGVLGAIWQSIRVVRPLREMAQVAKHIAGGDLSQRVPVTSRDEVGALAENFNRMAEALTVLMQERAAQAGLDREMELARDVQRAMLPPSAATDVAGHVVLGASQPTSRCGGDWWLYHALSPSRLLLVVGDAAGHGVHAALVAATARGALLSLIAAKGHTLTVDEVIRAFDAGTMTAQPSAGELAMSSLVVIADLERGELRYLNHGQPFPLVVKDGHVTALTAVNVAQTVTWHPSSLIALYTDGLPDQQNRKGMRFGDRRIAEAVRTMSGGALTDHHHHIIGAVIEFADGADSDDDITLVLCQAPASATLAASTP